MPLFNHGKVFPSLENNSEVSNISNVRCPHTTRISKTMWTEPGVCQSELSHPLFCILRPTPAKEWSVFTPWYVILFDLSIPPEVALWNIRKVPWFYWKILFFMKFMPSSCCLLLFGSVVGRRKRRTGHKFGDCCLIGSRQTERGLNLQWPPSLPVCPPCHRCWQHVFVQWIKWLFVLNKEGIYNHF